MEIVMEIICKLPAKRSAWITDAKHWVDDDKSAAPSDYQAVFAGTAEFNEKICPTIMGWWCTNLIKS